MSDETSDFFDFGDGNGPVLAHRHCNSGGWVADTAYVAETASVGPDALVFGNAVVSGYAKVYDNARVCDYARVFGSAWVYGNAVVSGYAKVFGHARVFGNAVVSGYAKVYGNAQVYGYMVAHEMSDDIVGDMNNASLAENHVHLKARIEELEAEIARLRQLIPRPDQTRDELEADNKALRSVIEEVVKSTGDDPEIMAASRAEWAARALAAETRVKELEAELALYRTPSQN